jgi:endonuclease/exonuclease/phosphatase family metal-dependent hydrolase
MSGKVTLKIMTFNMRCSTAADGINCFENRKPRIKAMLEAEDPDIIGFQEITPLMRTFLVEVLDAYYTVGAGRGMLYDGESSLVAFKKADFQLVASDTVMLSNTPAVQGSIYEGSDQSNCPREYVKVTLKHGEIDEPFNFYNVHTDHKGSLARILASMQMLQDICSTDRQFLLTGDLNATPNATEIRLITDCTSRNISDLTEQIDGTFHNYGAYGPERRPKIDYIFASEGFAPVSVKKIADVPENGVYYSDHFAVMATVTI